jgi:hypothetical protein
MACVFLNRPAIAISPGQGFPRQRADSVFQPGRRSSQALDNTGVCPHGKMESKFAAEPIRESYHCPLTGSEWGTFPRCENSGAFEKACRWLRHPRLDWYPRIARHFRASARSPLGILARSLPTAPVPRRSRRAGLPRNTNLFLRVASALSPRRRFLLPGDLFELRQVIEIVSSQHADYGPD